MLIVRRTGGGEASDFGPSASFLILRQDSICARARERSWIVGSEFWILDSGFRELAGTWEDVGGRGRGAVGLTGDILLLVRTEQAFTEACGTGLDTGIVSG